MRVDQLAISNATLPFAYTCSDLWPEWHFGQLNAVATPVYRNLWVATRH